MTLLTALADAIATARQAARFLAWCAALAAGAWLGWSFYSGVVG